jgi:16S rRNA (uracil1498-N3)-methyltransferase
MRIPRIYLPSQLKIGQSVELTEHAFQHVIKVLRLKQDAKLILFDGQGIEVFATVETINKKNASVTITESVAVNTESSLSIHLGLGISKGERMDYAIQKAVELGVSEITPLLTEHCVVNIDGKRMQKRLHHWQGIIISACEQSGRNILPLLHTTTTLEKWTKTINETCIVFDPLATTTLKKITPENNNINLVIGPEGGLSTKEILELEKKENFHKVKFGPRILRTETAAVSAITAIQVLWGDLLE